MGNFNKISSCILNCENLISFSHTRNSIVRISAIHVPLINQVRIIVVVDVSCESSLTTLTDSCFRSSNVDNRFVININFERLTISNTTIGIRNLNGEGEWVVESSFPVLSIVVMINTTINTETFLVMFIPSVGQVTIILTVNPCNQVYIVCTGLFISIYRLH